MKNNFKQLFVALSLGLVSSVGQAALLSTAVLNFDAPVIEDGLVVAGSNFGVDFTNDGTIELAERTGLVSNDGLILGLVQPASVTEPGIDQPWLFFGNEGIHQTTSAVTIISDDGAGNVALDFSGWAVNWNGLDIGLGGSSWGSNADGVAIMTCAVDCSEGDAFTLFYTATVTEGAFIGVRYRLGFDSGSLSASEAPLSAAEVVEDPGVIATGTIGASAVVPVPAAVWLFGSGLLGLVGIARRKIT